MKYTSVSSTDIGLVRQDNQDSLYPNDALRIWAVADGMGGGEAGGEASAMVCECLRAELENAEPQIEERHAAIARALELAAAKILKTAKERGFSQMGSTAAVLCADPGSVDRADVCHVGDSRIYRIRGGTTEPLTRDHTLASELGSRMGLWANKFTDRKNPLAHVLTRAVGTTPEVKMDWSRIEVQSGDRFVICSDGVHDVISDEDFVSLISDCPLEAAKEKLSQCIVERGAPDNYTFIIIDALSGEPAE